MVLTDQMETRSTDKRLDLANIKFCLYNLAMIRFNSSGFTLIELMVGAMIGIILMAVIAAILTIAQYQYLTTRDRMIAEARALEIENALKSILTQAVEVRHDANAAAGAFGNQPGRLAADFNWSTLAAPTWTVVGFFRRELRVGYGTADPVNPPGALGPALRKTAIFYREPTATTSGVLFIDLGTNVDATAMAPGYNDLYFDRISSLSMDKVRHQSYDRVTTANFTVSIRYHYAGIRNRIWCPAANMGVSAGCTANSGWRDLNRSFSILLRNNLLIGTAGAAQATNAGERVLGNLHFFQPVIPKRPQ